MSPLDGRWVGGEYQWPCPICGAMLSSKSAPATNEACRCGGCRAEMEIADAFQAVRSLIRERDAWRERALRAEKGIADALALANELDDTGGAPTEPAPANDCHV